MEIATGGECRPVLPGKVEIDVWGSRYVGGECERPFPSSKHSRFMEWERLYPIIPRSIAAVCRISADTISRKMRYIHCTARNRVFCPVVSRLFSMGLPGSNGELAGVGDFVWTGSNFEEEWGGFHAWSR